MIIFRCLHMWYKSLNLFWLHSWRGHDRTIIRFITPVGNKGEWVIIHESLSNNLHFGFEMSRRWLWINRQTDSNGRQMVFSGWNTAKDYGLCFGSRRNCMIARYKDFDGFYGFKRAFEGFCGLEQVFQGILASWKRNHNICNI